jgi:hypothetical protein
LNAPSSDRATHTNGRSAVTSRNAECTPRVIRVTIEMPDPLSGTVKTETGEALPFVGWLGLLGVLSKLVCPDRERGDRCGERARDDR